MRVLLRMDSFDAARGLFKSDRKGEFLGMELNADARIAFDRETVYKTYRDDLPQLVPYLPDIKRIVTESREEQTDNDVTLLRLVNRWEAKAEIPSLLRGLNQA